jgi:hypothetical protein
VRPAFRPEQITRYPEAVAQSGCGKSEASRVTPVKRRPRQVFSADIPQGGSAQPRNPWQGRMTARRVKKTESADRR